MVSKHLHQKVFDENLRLRVEASRSAYQTIEEKSPRIISSEDEDEDEEKQKKKYTARM